MKNSFIVYTSTSSLFKKLSDKDAGQLIKAVFEYVETGELPEDLPPGADMAFTAIQDYLDRDGAKYEEICRKRSEAGKLGGRPKKDEKAKKANESKKSNCRQKKQIKAKKADIDIDIDIDNDIEIDSEIESDNTRLKARYYPEDEKLDQAFMDYIEMRKKIRKPMTERAITLAQNKLAKLAAIPFSDKMDNDLAIQILEQSTMNSWLGLFELKTGGGKDTYKEWKEA